MSEEKQFTPKTFVRDGLVLAAVLGFFITFQTAITHKLETSIGEPTSTISAQDATQVTEFNTYDNENTTGFDVSKLYPSDYEALYMIEPAAGDEQ